MEIDAFTFMLIFIGTAMFLLIFMAIIVINMKSRKLNQKEETNNYINNNTIKPTTCFTIPVLNT
jgi:hypothetical protein